MIAARRREQVVRLRTEGYRLRQIADKLGISEQRVSVILADELEKLRVRTADTREQYRVLELEKLDRREREVRGVMALLSRSEVQTYLKCQEQLNKIAAHRAKLLHLEDKTAVLVPVVPPQEADPLEGLDVSEIVKEALAWQPPRVAIAESVSHIQDLPNPSQNTVEAHAPLG